jgi:ATP-dependent RNA helicase RhlE
MGDKITIGKTTCFRCFSKIKKWVFLVATDIAARGIDIDQLPYVINFRLTKIFQKHMFHRIGRTGRAWKTAEIAISFCSKDEHPVLERHSEN